MFFEIFLCTVKLFAYSAGMMPQQWYFGLYQIRRSMLPNILYHPVHGFVAFFKIASINTHPVEPGETCRIIICIHYPHLFGTGTYTPVIILYQVNHRQLLQYRKLQGFAYSPLRYTGIAQRTNNNGLFAI